MDIPIISIICPVYNAENYLDRSINSVIQQTFAQWELILVNDGSQDNSGYICDEFSRKDNRIKVFHKKNAGVGSARQKGLELSTGDYIIHIDPDDWIEFTMLEKMYNMVKEEDPDMVICDILYHYNHKDIISKQAPTNIQDNDSTILDILNHMIHGSCCNKLTRRKVISDNNIRFYDGLNYCEDVIFNIQLLKLPIKVAYLSEALYHYDQYINDCSITRRSTKSKLCQYKLYCDYLTSLIDNSSIIYNLKLDTKKFGINNGLVSSNEIKQIYPEIRFVKSKFLLDSFFYSLGFIGFVNLVKPYFYIRRIILNFFLKMSG